MIEPLTEVDILLLERWPDTVGIREAIKELEDRLGDRLETVAERLRPWLANQGYELFEVEKKYAAINIVKKAWRKGAEDAYIYISIGGLFPFGYRRVDEEHPYVWLTSDGLTEDEQQRLQADVTSRLKDRPGGWLNDQCDEELPAGRYVASHGDAERGQLAKSDESLESFIKAQLEPILCLSADFDAAFENVRRAKQVKLKT